MLTRLLCVYNSRKRFSEKQAEQWWADNRGRVYEQYNVRMVDKASEEMPRSSSLTPAASHIFQRPSQVNAESRDITTDLTIYIERKLDVLKSVLRACFTVVWGHCVVFVVTRL